MKFGVHLTTLPATSTSEVVSSEALPGRGSSSWSTGGGERASSTPYVGAIGVALEPLLSAEGLPGGGEGVSSSLRKKHRRFDEACGETLHARALVRGASVMPPEALSGEGSSSSSIGGECASASPHVGAIGVALEPLLSAEASP